ncbi:MAG: hypothetical protein R6W97_13120 [Thiobacillus sp.]
MRSPQMPLTRPTSHWPSSLVLMLALLAGPVQADEFDQYDTSKVNEGTLSFLVTPPVKTVHHHQNDVRIDPESLATGWVSLVQCHDHLDAVPSAQITFREGYVRNLRVIESRAIGEAWSDGSSVQLRDVKPGARLCLDADMRALTNTGNGYYALFSGPYMRKFLDGYYPMRVSLHIAYPAADLKLVDITPSAQTGFAIQQATGEFTVDTLFEGALRIQVQFEKP